VHIPSYAFIARAMDLPADAEMSHDGPVSVDAQTFKLLLRFVALAADFDEATYLKENPDLADAHEAGQIGNLRQHFIESGFFEGRKAAASKFDEDWYLKTYPDVADSVKEGVIASGRSHFLVRGEIEMRSPNEESLPWMQAWAEAFSRARSNTAQHPRVRSKRLIAT
jgi:hypothetical protein